MVYSDQFYHLKGITMTTYHPTYTTIKNLALLAASSGGGMIGFRAATAFFPTVAGPLAPLASTALAFGAFGLSGAASTAALIGARGQIETAERVYEELKRLKEEAQKAGKI